MKDRHWLVTGASAGIGAAIARSLAARGARLTLVARREEPLRGLAATLDTRCEIVGWDLSEPERVGALVEEVVRRSGPVEGLVNNAGLQVVGRTHLLDPDAAEATLRTNLSTPLRLVRAVLPGMLERGSGALVNVASMAALAPTPAMTWYNAGKAGLAAASEALRGELAGSGVDVLTVYPGIIADTDMAKAGLEKFHGDRIVVRMQPTGTSTELAERVVRAVEARRARLIWPKANTVARHFPAATRWFLDTFTPLPA